VDAHVLLQPLRVREPLIAVQALEVPLHPPEMKKSEFAL
jgi:hypothetical protein